MEQLAIPLVAATLLILLCLFAPTENSAEYIVKKAMKDRKKLLKQIDRESKR